MLLMGTLLNSIVNQVWWNYLEADLQELLKQSVSLIELVEEDENNLKGFHDYSFIVFAASKCYEGFLKKFFFDLGFITQEDYFGKRFRVGKSLNPQLEKKYREVYGVYDKLVHFFGRPDIADDLWNTWIECRNQLFHWIPGDGRTITFLEAKAKVDTIIATIDKAFIESKL